MFDQAQEPKIIRTSLRLQKLIAYADLENTPKLMLGMICQHHNDSRGYAHPSEDLLALLCNMCKRTVQRYLKALSNSGLLLIKRIPGLRCNAYVIQEQALEAIKLQRPNLAASIFSENEPVDNFAANLKLGGAMGDISSAMGDISSAMGDISSAMGDTQMSHRTVLNGIELKRTDEAAAIKNAAVHKSAPAKPAKRAEQPSSSSSFFEELQKPVEQEALANWQLTRIAKKKSALPTPLQCKLLVEQARSIGKPLGWVVQVMALNDWASFDKSWLQNQRPAPKLPMEESPVIDKPAPQAHNAPTVARAPVSNPYPATPAQVPEKQDDSGAGAVPEGLAKTRALLAEMKKSMAPAKPVASRTDGKQTWAEKVEKARRGEYVSHYALTSACQMLGLNYAALKAEIKAAAAEETAIA